MHYMNNMFENMSKPYKRTLNDRSPQQLIEHVKKLRQSEKMENITEDMNSHEFK